MSQYTTYIHGSKILWDFFVILYAVSYMGDDDENKNNAKKSEFFLSFLPSFI